MWKPLITVPSTANDHSQETMSFCSLPKESLKKLPDFLRTKCKMKTRHSPGLWRQVVTTVFWLNGPWKTQKTKGITNSELNITQPPNQVSKQDRVTPLTAAAGRLSAGRAWLPTEPSCWPEMPKPHRQWFWINTVLSPLFRQPLSYWGGRAGLYKSCPPPQGFSLPAPCS